MRSWLPTRGLLDASVRRAAVAACQAILACIEHLLRLMKWLYEVPFWQCRNVQIKGISWCLAFFSRGKFNCCKVSVMMRHVMSSLLCRQRRHARHECVCVCVCALLAAFFCSCQHWLPCSKRCFGFFDACEVVKNAFVYGLGLGGGAHVGCNEFRLSLPGMLSLPG